jgi:hypothetical protein
VRKYVEMDLYQAKSNVMIIIQWTGMDAAVSVALNQDTFVMKMEA